MEDDPRHDSCRDLRARIQQEEEQLCAGLWLGAELDAALLLMPVVGFLPGSDPRVKGTVEAIERELMPDGLVMRYNTAKVKDGLPPGEGVFLACSFWMVSSLKAIGREKRCAAAV
jgi:GH15 family glucan-1,4-alpha-glucosidase